MSTEPTRSRPAATASSCARTTALRARSVNRSMRPNPNISATTSSFGTNRFWTACLVTPMP